jgi:polyhydroxyalkanoate synthase
VETGGASVLDGLRNFLDDMTANRGKPRQVDASQFEVGGNLACTPGKVVYRNDLMELIQYAPQTETVHAVPLLMSPPWINRYYIMDLAPGRSFVEWAVSHGHTTFAISYRNPDSSMREVGLEDYLLRGLGEAVDVVREITGAPKVNVAGLCVGGTLAVMLGAWLAGDTKTKDGTIASTTLLNTLVDFGEPGQLGVFTDTEAVTRVEARMAAEGYLDGRELADTFDSLRANDLIWNYVGSSWLQGEGPPAFDILAWNADATNVPEATHSQYLRALYLSNSLARGSMRVKGRNLAPKGVTSDTYVLAARGDHITPWLGSYRTTGLLGGAVRFVLSSAGHIAGIVNPPGPKRKYWTNDDLPPEPEGWLAGATEHPGSWWEDWAGWIAARAGDRKPAPLEPGSTAHPALTDAPGTYVTG